MHDSTALAAVLLALASFSGCDSSGSSAAIRPVAPAHVEKPVKEAELATISLTPEAETRLGITLVNMKRKAVVRTRTFGGEVVVPPGRSAIVSAPLTGTISIPDSNKALTAGSRVTKGQAVFQLQPLLNPPDRVRLAETIATLASSRVEAEGQVEKAAIQLDAAKLTLARAEQLLKDKAGSAKAVDEAKTQLAVAEAGLRVAEARRDLLKKTTLEAEASSLNPIPIVAPDDAILQNVHAIAGQIVSAGSPLFDMVRLDFVWIRVSLYAGYLPAIALDRDARVRELGQSPTMVQTAKPIAAPLSANATSVTVDLYYELDNSEGRMRPGQRVSVTLRLNEVEGNLIVPQSSIVHDVYGGTWVYERVAPRNFVRRRVEVLYIEDDEAVLASGPADDAEIVAQGAAEIFGTELGFAK